MPRTTINIDASILDELKRIQEKEGTSLGAVANTLLADALAAKKRPASARRLRWNAHSMGARVSVENKEALRRTLDEENDRRRG